MADDIDNGEGLFEVIDIKQKTNAFTVEVEVLATRERRFFGYPIGEGWETEVNGESRFITDIEDKLLKEGKVVASFDLDSMKDKFKGKKK